ncbi:cyclopropane-fatty-acyl-phospholipid synthase [Clostridium acidisoli DSM 12555]|uniref:Cyclopropane-fatty-acyl-phospholipid synthase n=1 Tax=Clostridium acidisoli DSM 12555 TaxID=1121291 RepID=A0A1W1XFJ0_9CLOT|nr:cyclopropane-fatty-acyl-phospholipid synthase family protein [Clostridium acidisoli]SMC22795.1 cyclopropane-fatty-acyl-phospholipid synthase [Clostridium acidisoli DSM 12555]
MKNNDSALIEAIEHIFKQTEKNFNVEFWNGETINYTDSPKFTLKFNDKDAFKKIMTKPSAISFAEAFIDKTFDIEGDVINALTLKDQLNDVEISNSDKLTLLLKGTSIKEAINMHTKEKDKENIAHHYDISNDFYRLFLGSTMTYSCAYFKNEDDDLTTAQENKVDHICKKLRLKPGEKLLDVGCGWGKMIMWAAKHYGVEAHGVTISEEQYKYVTEKIKEEKLEDKCFVELKDYRDIEGEGVYDKIVSIGMFEHVGKKNLPLYFDDMFRLLKEDGLFLNHGITHSKKLVVSKEESEFIEKYIFPGGELQTVSDVITFMEDANYEVCDVESLREHYSKTLVLWVNNLMKNKDKAIEYSSERTYRTWLLYMIGCALNFHSGSISIYQILLSKSPKKPIYNIPLTREYMYK